MPGVEELKIFEMPVPGFFGFPPFAVECFILWQALVLAGVAVPRFRNAFPATTSKRVFAATAAAVFSLVTLMGMEVLTWDSFKPRIADLPEVPAQQLAIARYDAFSLASAQPTDLAQRLGADIGAAARWIDRTFHSDL